LASDGDNIKMVHKETRWEGMECNDLEAFWEKSQREHDMNGLFPVLCTEIFVLA
jgi:hypothetical protein